MCYLGKLPAPNRGLFRRPPMQCAVFRITRHFLIKLQGYRADYVSFYMRLGT